MASITHPQAGFTGTDVIANRAYEFSGGTATADLNATERVVLTVNGYRVEDRAPSKVKQASGKNRKSRRPEQDAASTVAEAEDTAEQVRQDPEIGADVEVTEEPPMEIG
mgnify:CR=1 FL=1